LEKKIILINKGKKIGKKGGGRYLHRRVGERSQSGSTRKKKASYLSSGGTKET